MENNNSPENQNSVLKEICEHKHYCKKCLVIVLLSFLGGFLTAYLILDKMIEKQIKYHLLLSNPYKFEENIIRDLDKIHKKEIKQFEKFQNKLNQTKNPNLLLNTIDIRTQADKDNYNIIVNLTPFQNDESKIKYYINGKKITVYGNNIISNNEYEENINFSQDFLLPANADTNRTQLIKENNKLIISTPLNNET